MYEQESHRTSFYVLASFCRILKVLIYTQLNCDYKLRLFLFHSFIFSINLHTLCTEISIGSFQGGYSHVVNTRNTTVIKVQTSIV